MTTETQDPKEATFAEITVKRAVKLGNVLSLLCSALEGGSNYWYMIEDYSFPEGVTVEDFREGGRFATPGEYHPSVYLIATHEGCGVIFSVKDHGEEGKRYTLDTAAIRRGLQVMADKYPRHFHDFTEENDDAVTGDVFLQCCLFGDVVYG